MSNVATVAGELLLEEKLDMPDLARVAKGYSLAVVQRIGWLLELAGASVDRAVDTEPLHRLLPKKIQPAPLAVRGPRLGDVEQRWSLWLNADVEPDL